MPGRTSTILHKSTGIAIRTPLLVPSFSSKGFPQGQHGKSEIGSFLQYASEFLTHTCLISAYDIEYGHIPDAEHLPLNLEILFLDSGGYEIAWEQDIAAVTEAKPATADWSLARYQDILAHWPQSVPAVLISYDHPDERRPVPEQLAQARDLFRSNQDHLNLFLLKPDDKDKITLKSALNEIRSNVEELAPFDMVGVTEKELGPSILDRMATIARLRQAMDEAGINAPIHVFGALDPISVCLYFAAGAEVFDGLTWMRYAYDAGRCVYFQNHSALNYGLHLTDRQARLRAMTDNIYSLHSLENRLREFVATQDYSKFDNLGEFMKKAVDSLSTRLKGGG